MTQSGIEPVTISFLYFIFSSVLYACIYKAEYVDHAERLWKFIVLIAKLVTVLLKQK
jgi:hypothetical protein